MLSIKDTHIEIHNPDIVRFLTKYDSQPYLKSRIYSIIVDTLNTLEKIIDDNKNDTNLILENIHAFQQNEPLIVRSPFKPKTISSENTLFTKMQNILPSRDNFTLTDVSHIPQSCDFLVERSGFPNIRIESKSYDLPISFTQLEKFQNDLLTQNVHGIFISATSPIATKNSIEIEQLVNGKFVIYLSKNNYDIDFIIDNIYFLYKLDSLVSSFPNSSNIILTPDTIKQINHFITQFKIKISDIKDNVKKTLDSLNSICFEQLEKILLQQFKTNTIQNNSSSFKCQYCDKVSKNKRGLHIHLGSCPKKKLCKTIVS
jgi:hypothetical protein